MKVFIRVFSKFIVLLLVIAIGAGGAAAFQGQRQSTPDYAISQYLSLLTDNSTERAYTLLDQTEGIQLGREDFDKAVAGKKYSLYSAFELEEQEKRRDSEGNEYVDFHAKFLDAADEVQAEEDFTVKKQSDRTLGVFDKWKVLGSHCMVQDFSITVPAGSTVYLDSVQVDPAWMTSGANSPYDVYVVPQLLPAETGLTIRHPVLESVNTSFNPAEDTVDYSTGMAFKQAAQDSCKELGVAVLKSLLTAAVKEQKSGLDASVADCKQEAEKFVEDEGKLLHREGADFVSIAASAFAAQYGEPQYSDEDGSIRVEMTFSYHYRIKQEVTTESEDQVQEDGTPMEVVQTVSDTGNSTAKFTLAYRDGAWKVAGMELPLTQ